MRSFFIAALFILNGQDSIAQKHIKSLTLEFSFPQGEYKDIYPKTASGILFSMLWGVDANYIYSAGGEVGIMTVNSALKSIGDYVVSTTNNIITTGFKVRLNFLPEKKPLQVFIEGTIGTNFFLNTISITSDGLDVTGSPWFESSATVVGGGGAGIAIPLGKQKRISLLFKASYLYGGHTNYYTSPKIDDNGNVYLTARQSNTSMVLAEGGASFSKY